jgi:HEAT repeat protein
MGVAGVRAIPALKAALKDRVEPVRKAAGRAIRQIQYQVQYQRKLELKRQRQRTPR